MDVNQSFELHWLTSEKELGIISHNKNNIHILNLSVRCLDRVA